MSLAIGTRLGAYEITGRIGAGGMGEVYRSTDTRLGREVAIKTLPTALASDKDHLARLEREAKLLATLNHPHIATVHSLDELEGTLYLAMELVLGETLEEKLKAGALPVEDALRLALQIAEALEAAHGKGVIHRDLKPANIMVTAQAQVKVLDFGLAKAFSIEPREPSPGRSPARSLAMTQQGIILGTAGYMSPEQASGQATDQRADIWAFGVVLYEMLTGLPLFSGESVPHILAEVLKTEPDWKRLPKNLHPLVRHMLERCLAKRPRKRYSGIGDARVDIEEVLSDPAGATPAFIASTAAAPVSPLRRFGLPLGLAVGAAVAALAVWFAMLPEAPPVNRFEHAWPAELGFRRTGVSVLALSPDGRRFAMNTEEGIYLRRMGELESRLIPGTEVDLRSPFYSPDGQSIAYHVPASNQLHRIALGGGASVIVAGEVDTFRGAHWAVDGTILFAMEKGIYRVPATGGSPELVIPAVGGELFDGPQLLPDGDHVLFTSAPAGNWDDGEITIASLATRTRTRTVVHKGGSAARYLPTGHLVYANANNLVGISFDLATLSVSGGAVSLVPGLVRSGASGGTANYGISDDGTLVYLTEAPFGAGEGIASLVWLDREGNETPTGMAPCICVPPVGAVALSPDGMRAAVAILTEGDLDLWIWSFAEGTLSKLTFEPGDQGMPVWTPDGQRVIYLSGGEGVMARAADGTGDAEPLLKDPRFGGPGSLDADGNVLLTNGNDIHVLNVADGTASPLLAEPYAELHPAISPDGRFIAYASTESGRPEIYVRPYPDVESGKRQVSTDGGVFPRWSAEGNRLYFASGDGADITQAVVATERPYSRQTAAPIPFQIAPNIAFDVSADGERFLVLKLGLTDAALDAMQPRVIIVQNWIEGELKRLVPVD
jgi:serine/threonine-protein kinase